VVLCGGWLWMGCNVEQAPECQQLLDCARVLVPGSGEELLKVYGKEGGCWEGRATALRCAQSCRQALEGLRSEPGFAEAPACQR